MLIGLDISTSITGVSIVDGNTINMCDKIDLRNKKFESKIQKANKVKEVLLAIKNKYDKQINEIYIEEALSRFTPGMSSAQTLMSLASFNGVVSWLCYDIFNIEPKYIACRQARKMLGILVPKGGDAKKIVMQHWLDNEPQFTVEYSKFGNPVQGTFDRADSLVIAKAGQLLCQSKNSTS